MCANREHRYRMTYKLGTKPEQDIIVNAKGLPEAFAKLDGYVAARFPTEWVELKSHRTPLTLEQAIAHGAIDPNPTETRPCFEF
jgi:hypothetical protein